MPDAKAKAADPPDATPKTGAPPSRRTRAASRESAAKTGARATKRTPAGSETTARRAARAAEAVAAPAPLDEPDADDLLALPPYVDLDPADDDDREPRGKPAKKRGKPAKKRDKPAKKGRRASRREQRRERRAHAKRRKRGEPLRHEVSAARRAELVAAAAALAAAGPDHVSSKAARPRRHRAIARLAVIVVVALVAAAATALVMAREPITPLSEADAGFMSAQLVRADQRVRTQLALLDERGTATALDRTRDALATTRSLTIETRGSEGGQADALRRALMLEAAWLDAVGSALSNPTSPLIAELRTRDAALRPALAELPTRPGTRAGGAQALVDYSRTRSAG